MKSYRKPHYVVYKYRALSCFNLFPEHHFNQVIATISFAHPKGDAIPEAKALYSLDCFNVPESSCANKQAVTVKRVESLSPRFYPGVTTIPTCAFYLINPMQRHFAGP